MLTSPLGVGHSIPIMGSLHNRNQIADGITNPSTQRQEVTFDPIAVEAIAPGSKFRDHLLLAVQAGINGTSLRALVDSGAIRSFIDEKLQLRPPLTFIGAYSSWEMANGETIVSTRVAPYVLISIGKIQFRFCLTTVPMMEGFDLILGKDWLDMVNPLVDWCSNTVFIRLGDGEVNDEKIQDKLDKVFKVQTGKVNSLNSFSSIFRTRSSIKLELQLRKMILKGLEKDTRWSDILHTLQSDKGRKILKQGLCNFRLANSLFEMQNKNAQDNSWKVVIPSDPEIKRIILEEIHFVPYAGHLGYQKTLKQIQKTFY